MNQSQKNNIKEEIKEAFEKKEYQEIDLKNFEVQTYANDIFSMCCIAGTNLITLLLLAYFIS